MLKLKKLHTRGFQPRRFYRARSRRFVLVCLRQGSVAAAEPRDVTPAQAESVMDLFPSALLQVEHLKLREKYGPRRDRSKKKKERKKGLQYKLQFWKGVNGKERERKFSRHTVDEDSNALRWTREDLARIAVQLVDVTFEEIQNCSLKGSAKIAEAVAWIERRYDDSPFNFEWACAAAGYSSEKLREMLLDWLSKEHGTTYPHYRVLRNGVIDAEYGDRDAVEWVLSDATSPLSFVDCCRALGFDPKKARQELLLPVVVNSFDELTADEATPSETFDFNAVHAA